MRCPDSCITKPKHTRPSYLPKCVGCVRAPGHAHSSGTLMLIMPTRGAICACLTVLGTTGFMVCLPADRLFADCLYWHRRWRAAHCAWHGRQAVHSSSGAVPTDQRYARGRRASAAASCQAAAPCRPPQCPARGAPSRTHKQRPEARAAAAGSPLQNCEQDHLPISVTSGEVAGVRSCRTPCRHACNAAP